MEDTWIQKKGGEEINRRQRTIQYYNYKNCFTNKLKKICIFINILKMYYLFNRCISKLKISIIILK